MKPLIGVIVPVYKVEKYVAECIDSILAQTYTKFRLILVDDGTPDNAGKICDEYAKKDPRITVIHQENAGVTRARARGVEEATDCEFIMFVDSDDTINKTTLQKLSGVMNEDVDITMCAMFKNEEQESKHKEVYSNKAFIDINEFINRVIFLRGGIGGKLYRKKLFDEFTFDIPRDIVFGEDSIMNLRLALKTDKNIGFINSQLYRYNQHAESCCHSFNFTTLYEEKLIEHTFKSIPECQQENYKELYLKRRLWAWTRRYNNSIRRPKWANSEFHGQLLEDIRNNNLAIDRFSKLLLIYTNPFVRFFIISYRKCCSLIKKWYNVLR